MCEPIEGVIKEVM